METNEMQKPVEIESGALVDARMHLLENLKAIEDDDTVKFNCANFIFFINKYKERGVDLEKEYSKRWVTGGIDEMNRKFQNNKENGEFSKFAETLPLLANRRGRLGDYISAKIIKTARPDDVGNDAVDLVIEIKNDYVKENEEFKDVKPSIKICVDVTTNRYELKNKNDKLNEHLLDGGRMANVLCYENSLGSLGLNAPKVVVLEDESLLLDISNKMTRFVSGIGNKFTINNTEDFDVVYREYFMEILNSIKINAFKNIEYLDSCRDDKVLKDKRKNLRDSYMAIVDFIDVYQKTPTQKLV